MSSWKETLKASLKRGVLIPVLAVAMAASVGVYELAKPTSAAAVAAAAPAPLDDNSVSALLSLDQAMETLAARVTPAVVNITVTSKTKGRGDDNADQDGPTSQQFAPDNNPFGNFGPFRFFEVTNAYPPAMLTVVAFRTALSGALAPASTGAAGLEMSTALRVPE